MDIKWKDGEGNILNADNKSIKYLDAKDNKKYVINNDEVKKIIIDDGLMNIFGDFEHDLLESSLAAGHPLAGIVAIVFIALMAILIVLRVLQAVLGEFGLIIARILIIGYPIYAVLSYVHLIIKRKQMAKVIKR